MSFTSPQLRFYFSSISCSCRLWCQYSHQFSKYFSENHSPCQKWPQRDVTTLPWTTSLDWLLRILNNFSFSEKFSFSEVVWLPLLCETEPTHFRVTIRKPVWVLFKHVEYYQYTSSSLALQSCHFQATFILFSTTQFPIHNKCTQISWSLRLWAATLSESHIGRTDFA